MRKLQKPPAQQTSVITVKNFSESHGIVPCDLVKITVDTDIPYSQDFIIVEALLYASNLPKGKIRLEPQGQYHVRPISSLFRSSYSFYFKLQDNTEGIPQILMGLNFHEESYLRCCEGIAWQRGLGGANALAPYWFEGLNAEVSDKLEELGRLPKTPMELIPGPSIK